MSKWVPKITVCTALFLISACTQNDGNREGTTSIVQPHEPYPSPFKERKVILAAASFGKATEDENNELTVDGLSVTVVVDNTCSANQCTGNVKLNGRSLACHLYQKKANPKQDVQFHKFKLPRRLHPSDLDRWVKNDPCVIGIANNMEYRLSAAPNDSYYSQQVSYLSQQQFEDIGKYISPGDLIEVGVAVIDSGVGVHPDLGGSTTMPGVVWREDLRSEASKNSAACKSVSYTNETPYNTHGTFVGGIIAATPNNSLGITGIAPNARLISLAIGDCTGLMSTDEVANALTVARSYKAEVVNLSIGDGLVDDVAVRSAVVALLNKNAVIVAAAGNTAVDLRKSPRYPASYSYLDFITVGWGTVDANIEKGNGTTWGSNYGDTAVKILAPGNSIVSTVVGTPAGYTLVGDGYGSGRGSSFAAPQVSAAAAIAMGYLKKKEFPYGNGFIEARILESAYKRDELRDYVKDGNVLNFGNLASNLKSFVSGATNSQPVVISNPNVSINSNSPSVTFSATWSVPTPPYGSRLGVFDGTCGFSAPCIIQDFELQSTNATKYFNLTRNELLPTLANLSDPDFALPVSIAVYYRVPDGDGKFKNNYGVAAKASIDIRSLDASTSSSPILGGITNLRTDMLHMYVQGWTCLKDSNKALKVELLDQNGTPVAANSSYYYPWMFDHEPEEEPGYKSVVSGPFVARDFKTYLTNKTSYKAGLEANPYLMLEKCRTFTVAHGFEFAVPLDSIRQNGWSGTRFSVRATNPNDASKTMNLTTPDDKTDFVVPSVNSQPSITSNVTLTRANDAITVSGNLCSASPAPIQVEISMSAWDLKCRIVKNQDFPLTTDPCHFPPDPGGLPDYVNDPAFSDQQTFVSHSFEGNGYAATTFTPVPDFMKPSQALSYRLFPGLWPNASVRVNWGPPSNWPFGLSTFLARGVRDIASGLPIVDIQWSETETPVGATAVARQAENNLDRYSISTKPFKENKVWYWDWYDVGEPYTYSVVAYQVNADTPVGDYLYRNFGVKKYMREIKKFETPLSVFSQTLAHDQMLKPTIGGGSCPYRFALGRTLDKVSLLTPGSLTQILYAITGNAQIKPPFFTEAMSDVMQTVPLDIRFFQDGVMILHLVSNFADKTFPVTTLGRGGP